MGKGCFTNSFDTIVFMFPHVGSGETDMHKNVEENLAMLSGFFQQCVNCLDLRNKKASVLVTPKEGEPYTSWKIGSLCTKATDGALQVKTAYSFDPQEFPGYAHRRTLGFKEGLSKQE